MGSIRLQILVEIPELPPHLFQRRAVGLSVRDGTRQWSLRMHPAGRMDQDVEPRRAIAEDHEVWRYPLLDELPQQRPFGGNPHVPFRRDARFGQPSLPGRGTRELPRTRAQGRCHVLSQFLTLPVGQRHLMDRLTVRRAPRRRQKVPPALAVRALKIGEQVVAQRRAITVASFVPRPRIVHADVGRYRQSAAVRIAAFS